MRASRFSTVNPAAGEQIETFSFFTAGETEATLARAEKSFQSYRKQAVHQRAQLLSNLRGGITEEQALQRLTTQQRRVQGRPPLTG
jgi:acyl-CoA reductase-like NAD-dependent aldehyde dehydrogenase